MSSQGDYQRAIFKDGKNCGFLPDPGQELPGGFPESNFKGEIGNFLPDPGQELPGGFPESNFKGKIGNFLPDPSQELPRLANLRLGGGQLGPEKCQK